MPKKNELLQFRSDYTEIMNFFNDNPQYISLMNIIRGTESSFTMNRILMQRLIDTSWVEAIEKGLVHVDNVLRNPGRTIEDIEEIVPIALSRNITIESVKHLAQHTDLIQSVDKKTGRITPSKILNVHKEETLMTYENKFINTLIERLNIFINVRYEKLAEVTRDGEIFTLGFKTTIDDNQGGKTKIEINIENDHDFEKRNRSSYTVWQRVKKLKSIIEGYKDSELCRALGNTYIRPPVMRTNAIMKNVDLKACLTLWLYIESYDKVGYEINIENSAMEPNEQFVDDFYELIGLHMLLFRASESPDQDVLETKKLKPIAPKVLRQFASIEKRFNLGINADGEGIGGSIDGASDGSGIGGGLGYGYGDGYGETGIYGDGEGDGPGGGSGGGVGAGPGTGPGGGGSGNGSGIGSGIGALGENGEAVSLAKGAAKRIRGDSSELREVTEQVKLAIAIEQAYRDELRAKELEAQREAEEAERRRLEEERIEAERQAELKRIAERKAEEERKIQEMLERARKEEEAAERERQRKEKERLAAIEKQRKKAAEDKAKLDEMLLQRSIADAEAEEKFRIDQEAYYVRLVLGFAFGMDESCFEPPKKKTRKVRLKRESPSELAKRLKEEQQQKEKERAEAERAQKLDTDRRYFESKPVELIFREYSKNPIWIVVHFIEYVLAMVFGIIPKNTDRPDFKKRRSDIIERRERQKNEKEQRSEMEVYYKKYGQTFKYRTMRAIADYKFRRKRAKEERSKPKTPYVSKLTPEEQKARQKEMRALYKRYHVSFIERIRRWFKAETERISPTIEKIRKMDKKPLKKAATIIAIVLMALSLAFTIYVTVCTMTGKVVNVFGYSVLKVETGSMEPTLHVDDFIIIKRCDPSKVKAGDIISFYSTAKETEGMLITHRVMRRVSFDKYVTRGDANPVNDSVLVQSKDILGVYVRKSGVYKWLGSFANTNKLFLLFVLLPLILVSVYELRSMLFIAKEAFGKAPSSKKDEEYERRMREAIEAEKKRLAEEDYRPESDEVNDT